MKNLLTRLLLTIAVFCTAIFAQAQQYTVSSIPYTPFSYTSGVNVVSPTDDKWSSPVGIGFDFYFFGQPYQSLIIGTNALVTFDTSKANTYCQWNLQTAGPLPTTATYTNSIMFPYHDVDISAGGTIKHQVYGSIPNRKFVVSFSNVPMYDDVYLVGSCYGVQKFTGQLVLHETTNIIDMYIESKEACPGWNAGLAIMGIQNIAGTDAYTVPGRNNTVWSANNEGWRFSPDSNYAANLNRISGHVFLDNNKDCIKNANEMGLKNRPVLFKDSLSGNITYTYTDIQGNYSKLVDTGHFTVYTQNIAAQFTAPNCPPNGQYHITFTTYNDSSDNNIFADTISQHCSAIVPGLMVLGTPSSWWTISACDSARIKINAANQGVIADTAKVLLSLNDSTTILYSPVPYTDMGNNKYLFDLGVLLPTYDTVVTLIVSTGCDTLASNYCYSLQSISNYPFACFANGNTVSQCVPVGVPFDPNTIKVSSANQPQLGAVDYLETNANDYFDYTIVFQNTGTAPANDVKLKIPISPKVSLHTLQPSGGSASYQWLVMDSTLIVDFFNIQLPDSGTDYAGSIGYFKFRINQKPGNMPNDLIVHQAAIYFDYLSPVYTNNSVVKLVDTAGVVSVIETEEQRLLLYPNPATEQVDIMTNLPGTLFIHDITGREMLRKNIVSGINTIYLTGWSVGVYLVRLISENQEKTFRLLKE